jgi:hypothetical protein
MSDRKFYKRCSYISIGFLILSIAVLIFGIAFFPSMIEDQIFASTALKRETSDIWSQIPGNSGVSVYKQTYLYDIENIDDLIYRNQRAIANETGPYTVNEFVELRDLNWSQDNTTVSAHYFKYLKNQNDNETIIQERHVNTLNIVALAVWYQAKNAPASKVALKALYTILHSLNPGLYYGYVQTLSINPNVILNKFNYWPDEKKQRFNDTDYGIYQNNSYFVQACLTHPSNDSEFIRNYFDLTYHEVEYFKKYFIRQGKIDTKYANDTTLELGLRQWLTLEINQYKSIYVDPKNITAPGYIEYGGYLKYLEKNTTSSLNLTQVKQLVAIREPGDYSVDNSKSVMNKKHMDMIFTLPQDQAVEYINRVLEIHNMEESKKFYNYLNYISGEMAFAYTKGGNGAIGALADFLSQRLPQIFYQMGWDLYEALLYKNLSHLFDDCITTLQPLIDGIAWLNGTEICAEKNVTPNNPNNTVMWYKSIMNNQTDLFDRLNIMYPNFTEYDYMELRRNDSAIKMQVFVKVIDKLLKEYNITGVYNAFSPLNFAIYQWMNSTATQEINSTLSLYDWNNGNYKTSPEFSVFCSKNFESKDCQIPLVLDLQQTINYDHLFSGRFIGECFMGYNNATTTGKTFYTSKPFISYLRYIFLNEVLNVYQKRTVKELLWGYQDEILNGLVIYQ